MSKWILDIKTDEIGDVRIYNRALSADEIDRSYRAVLWIYRYAFLMGMPWYGRLYFWLKVTWLVLIGKKK